VVVISVVVVVVVVEEKYSHGTEPQDEKNLMCNMDVSGRCELCVGQDVCDELLLFGVSACGGP
jgi:hypothetical protein